MAAVQVVGQGAALVQEGLGQFVVIVADGRQPGYSVGANLHDLVAFLKEAGASDAMNMDGGGSTTLVYWDAAAGKPVVCNRHSESGYTRPVAASMGIYFE